MGVLENKLFNKFINTDSAVFLTSCVVSLSLLRMMFILIYFQKISSEARLYDFIYAIVYGLEKDCVVSIIFSVIYSIFCLRSRGNELASSIYILILSILFISNVIYFYEFGNQFNYFMFLIDVYDIKSVAYTIIKSYYPVLSFISIILIFYLIKCIFIFLNFIAKKSYKFALPLYYFSAFALFLPLADFGETNVQFNNSYYQKIEDEFLQKTIDNPFTALSNSISDFMVYGFDSSIKEYLPDDDIRRASRELFKKSKAGHDLDKMMEVIAAGSELKKPEHIFFVVMESYGTSPMLEKYSSLQLTQGLGRLSENGVLIKNILPSAMSSQTTVASILVGIPNSMVNVKSEHTSINAYPTAPAAIFKKLGYKTRLFYGGQPERHQLGTLARSQGFDEIYGADVMGKRINHWGVDDKNLFEFIEKRLDDPTPSFNFIFTTTNHVPFLVNVYEKGFHLKSLPDGIRANVDKDLDLIELGHLWYSDMIVANFVEDLSAKYSGAIFAVTGDHPSRHMFNNRPSIYERSVVPLLLYGNGVEKYKNEDVTFFGNHTDIARTLIDMIAPNGFVYHSMGNNIFSKDRNEYSINYNSIISSNFIADLGYPVRIEALPGKALPPQLPEPTSLRKIFNNNHAVSWWRVKYGASLDSSIKTGHN